MPHAGSFSGLESVSGVWLKTISWYFVHETNIQEQQNFRSTLNECAPAPHWIGTLQTQCQRKDCYMCTSLNYQSQNLGYLPYADLQCSMRGEAVQGNRCTIVRLLAVFSTLPNFLSSWYQSVDDKCFFPGAIFAPDGWRGKGLFWQLN
jgi:hypothetical protein